MFDLSAFTVTQLSVGFNITPNNPDPNPGVWILVALYGDSVTVKCNQIDVLASGFYIGPEPTDNIIKFNFSQVYVPANP